MSDTTPVGPSQPVHPLPPESVQTHSDPPVSGRRTAGIAAVTAGTLLVVAGGAFAAVQFLGGGPRAEAALPAADTLAVVSVDLDPSARQKVEAIKTFRRFPALKKELGLSSGDDLRRAFFDRALARGACKDKLSYDADILPWIGDNAALAAATFTKGKVSPLLVLAVTDEGKAKKGLTALIDCSGSQKSTAFAVHDGFALITDTNAHADQAVKDTESKPLSDDPGYQKWVGRLKDRGVANFYVAKAAAGYLADGLGGLGGMAGLGGFGLGMPNDLPSDPANNLSGSLPSATPSSSMSPAPSGLASIPTITPESGSGASAPYSRPLAGPADPTDPIRKALANFQGAAGALRFADGGAELEVVSGGLDKTLVSDQQASDLVTGLPSDTAAVLGFAVPQGWASRLSDTLASVGGPGAQELLQRQLGITLPGDLESLLGQGLAVSVRGTPPDDLANLDSPKQVPVALTIKGDPAKIRAVIAKIQAQQGTTLAAGGITVEDGDGKVTLSFDSGYAKALLANGSLGDSERFRQVVPEADKASAVLYVDFTSAWRTAIAKALQSDGGSSSEFLANTDPLKALGLSSWSDGGVAHVLLKVTTD